MCLVPIIDNAIIIGVVTALCQFVVYPKKLVNIAFWRSGGDVLMRVFKWQDVSGLPI